MSPHDDQDSRAMPPPPVPILDPEFNALTSCLKNAVIKTGQIYSFYADRARLYVMPSSYPYAD
ncbi:hypothetical protein F5887DRAFT_942647 [Amanita rubescens]|nr:hypothetical protein F5887DRAFT_942647 [Amanita rubescens]